MAALDGNTIVALLGVVMALAVLSRNSALQNLSWRKRWLYGAVWAVIIGVVAAVASR